jgi:peptide/nickel transport system ATP-binding protein
MNEALVDLSELTVTRGGTTVLDRLSLRLEPGESAILLGEEGCGREAVVRVLGGFPDKADAVSGTITFAATPPRPAAKRQKPPIRIAYLPSPLAGPLSPHASVLRQLVHIIARQLGAPFGSAREELRLALERFPTAVTPELLDAKPDRLDPVTLAIGLLAAVSAQTPDLVLADHPFADLGPAAVRLLMTLFKAEHARLGYALIYSTGGLQAAARLGGRVLVLRTGRVVEEGDAIRLMGAHAHAYTKTLFKALPRLNRDPPKPRTAHRGQPLLQVHGLSFKSKTPMRDGLTFELRRNASLALVGEAGSGRRAMLRALLGFDKAPSGKVLFDAVDLYRLSEAMASRIRRRIAFVTGDDDCLDPRMSIHDTVDEPLRAHLDLTRDLIAGYRDAALKRVGLASHDGNRSVASLSLFDRRRLQVARAFVGAPLLVVVDEPLKGLDAFAQTIMREVLIDFRATQESAFLVMTSDLTVAQALADEALVFHDGKVVERGSIAHLVRDPKHDATKALIEAVSFSDLSPADLSRADLSPGSSSG